MALKSQRNREDQELIRGCSEGIPEAQERFYCRYQPTVLAIARGYTSNEQEAEDSSQEIIIKLFDAIGRQEISSLDAWVRKVSSNYCTDEYRRKKKREGKEYLYMQEEKEAIAPRRQPSWQPTIDGLYRRHLPSNLQRSLELSLEYVDFFYMLANKTRSESSVKRATRVIRILDSTKKTITPLMGAVKTKEIERFNLLKAKPGRSDAEESELEELKKREAQIHFQGSLNESIEMLKNQIHLDLSYFAFINSSKLSVHKGWASASLLQHAIDLSTIKIQPPRLIFDIWAKSEKLRKSSYTNLRKMKIAFRYAKDKTKGTDKEYLFDSLDKELSSFESLRKSHYKKTPNEKDYQKLVDFIYKYSFVYKN